MKMSIVKTDPFSIEIPKKPPNKSASEHRRATKPIMEKRRRARINNSLNELKTLILEALNKDPSRHSKLEKADILEMTVRYLQSLHKTQSLNDTTNIINKYKAGFGECAQQVTRYIQKSEGMDQDVKRRLISHLSNCLQSLDTQSANINSFIIGNNLTLTKLMSNSDNNNMIETKLNNNGHVISKNLLNVLKDYSPLNLTSTNQLDLNNNNNNNNNNCLNNHMETDLSTPPSSANSTLFTFNFPTIITNNNQQPTSLLSPHTPDTPTTPSPINQLPADVYITPYPFKSNNWNSLTPSQDIWRPW